MNENLMYGGDLDNPPSQTINEKLCDGTILIGYGRSGHGMNGKDADLERTGQCLVTSLETVDPIGEDSMRIDINLRLYASICCPSYDSIDFQELKEKAPKDLRDCFREYMSVDLDALDLTDYDKPETKKALSAIVEFYREQATEIVCGANLTPYDPFGFMWDGDGAWDGGMDIKLSVPLSVDEYDEIEHGNTETLDKIAQRIATEIYDGNKGGTKERDKMKYFEEELGLCNDLINQLLRFEKDEEIP